MTDDTLSQSEHSIIERLSISRLPQVLLNIQGFRHHENCPTIGWFLSCLKFPNQLWHGETVLGVPLAAGPDEGVPTEQGETWPLTQWETQTTTRQKTMGGWWWISCDCWQRLCSYSVLEQVGGRLRCFPLCRYCRSSVAMSWANGGSPAHITVLYIARKLSIQ